MEKFMWIFPGYDYFSLLHCIIILIWDISLKFMDEISINQIILYKSFVTLKSVYGAQLK